MDVLTPGLPDRDHGTGPADGTIGGDERRAVDDGGCGNHPVEGIAREALGQSGCRCGNSGGQGHHCDEFLDRFQDLIEFNTDQHPFSQDAQGQFVESHARYG